MRVTKFVFALFIAQVLCLFVPQVVFCQTETLDIIHYTPPKGWTKTPKEGVMVFTDMNKSTNGFCVLTVYPSTASAGSPQKDFANKWNEFAQSANASAPLTTAKLNSRRMSHCDSCGA